MAREGFLHEILWPGFKAVYLVAGLGLALVPEDGSPAGWVVLRALARDEGAAWFAVALGAMAVAFALVFGLGQVLLPEDAE